MKIRSFIIFICLLYLPGIFLSADDRLAELISGKKWKTIASLFSDSSHQRLEPYFRGALNIKFVTFPTNKLTYKAKFRTFAEIGTITYEKDSGQYHQLKIKNQIKPLIFIENFKQYRILNRKIKIGDAKITFRDGHFYHSHPYGQVLFFIGEWEFSITPSNREEQITLTQLYKKNRIERSSNWGIFILKQKDILQSLPYQIHRHGANSPVIPLLRIYREFFGIQIKQFKEFWYLPFRGEDNLIIFQKDRKSFYLYDFNEMLTPDTRMRISENHKIILSYNALNRAKLIFRKKDKIKNINLNLYYNPESDFLSGTANLTFQSPSSFRVLNLDGGLQIKASLDLSLKGLSVIRKDQAYYFLGPSVDSLSFFYRGNIQPEVEYSDIFKKQTLRVETIQGDKFYFLSRSQNFYPSTELDFFESRITVSLPKNFQCMASGQLTRSSHSSRNTFEFQSPGSKGISMACGEFFRVSELKSKIPLQIFTTSSGIKSRHFHVESFTQPLKKNRNPADSLFKYFDLKKLREAFDFLIESYGHLDLSEVNLLLRKAIQEGGVSNRGFIFFHYNPESSLSQKITRRSPINLSQDPTNHLIHELAHQWWGGLVSWNSYEDIWITEGFSQFSLLHYLEKKSNPKQFERILKRLKRGIYQANDLGPVVYGKRILTIHEDYESYQTIIYNKAAFILLMLKDMIGEQEFLKKTRQALKTFQYRSVSSIGFIRQFSLGNPVIFNFLNHWINHRNIPEASVIIEKRNQSARITVEQHQAPVPFPLTLNITTRQGESSRTLVVEQKRQQFNIRESSTIKSIRINTARTLVKIAR